MDLLRLGLVSYVCLVLFWFVLSNGWDVSVVGFYRFGLLGGLFPPAGVNGQDLCHQMWFVGQVSTSGLC